MDALSKMETTVNRNTHHPQVHNASSVRRMSQADVHSVVEVLCDAFRDYPVMRYIIAAAGGDYDRHLYTLINFFVMARVWRDEPILGVSSAGTLVAAAILTLPDNRPSAAPLAEHREALWRELGQAARTRYETYGATTQKFEIDQPHYQLNMIGVRRLHAGRGFARRLLDAVHALSQNDPASRGVTLCTEDPRNVAIYQHVGYKIIGHARVNGQMETWGLFRANQAWGNLTITELVSGTSKK